MYEQVLQSKSEGVHTAFCYFRANCRELHENYITKTRLSVVRNGDNSNVSAVIKNNSFVILSEPLGYERKITS